MNKSDFKYYLLIILLITFYPGFGNKINDMKKIEKGDRIPEFKLKDQNGNLFDISSVLGDKNLVIYF